MPRDLASSFSCFLRATSSVRSISSLYPKCGIDRAAVIDLSIAFLMPLIGSTTSGGTSPALAGCKIGLLVVPGGFFAEAGGSECGGAGKMSDKNQEKVKVLHIKLHRPNRRVRVPQKSQQCVFAKAGNKPKVECSMLQYSTIG